jgi:hypothetical protein
MGMLLLMCSAICTAYRFRKTQITMNPQEKPLTFMKNPDDHL